MRPAPPLAAVPDFSPSQAFHLSRPILGSLGALGALLLIGASPLSGVYLLETVVLTRVGSSGRGSAADGVDPGRDRWDEGGIGVWGGCIRDGGSFLSQSCSLSLPFRPHASSSSVPSSGAHPPAAPLPSFSSLLPPVLAFTLALALMTAFTAALASHVFNSWILWGSLSELGRPEGSAMPLTPAGRLRFGEGRWRRKWRERVRKVGLVGVGSCAVACAIILYPLLPTFYIPSPLTPPSASPSPALAPAARALPDDIPISLLLTPSWGLLLLAAAGALMVHGKDARGLRHGRRGSSLSVGGRDGLGGSGKCRSVDRKGSIDFNLPKSSSPLSSPTRTSPSRSPLVLSPTPRRASLGAAAPWMAGGVLTDEVEDMERGAGAEAEAETDGEGEGDEEERRVWGWSKEV